MVAKPQHMPLSWHPGGRETGHAHGTSLPGKAVSEGRDAQGLLNPERPGEHG